MEIKKDFLKEETEREKLKEHINELIESNSDKLDDVLMKEALKLTIVNNLASISLLQRRLGIGFSKAGQLLDDMENLKYISEANGSKPRKVFITREDYEKMYGEKLPYEDVLFTDKIQDIDKFMKRTKEVYNKNLFKDALKYVILFNKVNSSSLQRRFGIGFFRASELIDKMEDLKYISPKDGNGKREIYITLEEYLEKYGDTNEYNN